MTALTQIIEDGSRFGGPPWPRAIVSTDIWNLAAQQLAAGEWTMLAHWAEPDVVHLALLEPATRSIGIMSLLTPNGRFPSLGRAHPPARRFERAIRDLYGLVPEGAPDSRPWLDHGRWRVSQPLGLRNSAPVEQPYAFLPVEGDSLHQIPVGPVHAGIIEPGHFRFTASGETIVRLEARLGYVHKGIEGLIARAPLERAAQLAARASGDSTVAYGIAFAEAVEAAAGASVPVRALWLRALMLELERLANHFGDIGAVCNDAAFGLMHAHCAILRERVLRAAQNAFGHRLMMDRVVPGGVACDIGKREQKQIARLVKEVRRRFPALNSLYEDTTSLQDRMVGTGIVSPALVAQFGAGGFVGRASNRDFDARRDFGSAPYESLAFVVPTTDHGDVDARVWIRLREVEQSLSLIDQIIDRIPAGPLQSDIPDVMGEGMTLVEGFRGDVFAWVRVGPDGHVDRCHLRDPSWLQWPLLEAAIDGNIVADFPLCNKSFNCSYAGHDL